MRELDLRRLDSLLLTYWPLAKGGDTDALDRVLKILQRRAKLLGLDLPVANATRGGAKRRPTGYGDGVGAGHAKGWR